MTDLEKIIVGAIEALIPHYPDFVYEFCQAVTRWTIKDWKGLSSPEVLGYSGELKDWQKQDIKDAEEVVWACDVLLDYSGVKDG